MSRGWPQWRRDIAVEAAEPETSERDGDDLTVTFSDPVTAPVTAEISVVVETASDRVTVEVVLATGAPGSVEFRIHRDVVEVWLTEPWVGQHSCGVIDRAGLRSWLARRPREALGFDEVTLSVDRALDVAGRVAITLPNVDAWSLRPQDAQRLTERV